MVKTVLLLADTHVGSKTAVLHPDTPGYAFHNVGQEYLWECWQHMVNGLPKSIDYLVLLDEMVKWEKEIQHPNNRYKRTARCNKVVVRHGNLEGDTKR